MNMPKDAATDKTAGKAVAPISRLPEPPIGPEPPADAFLVLEAPSKDSKPVEPVELPKPAEESLKAAPPPTPVPQAPVPTPVPVKATPIDPPKAAVEPAPSTTVETDDEPVKTPRVTPKENERTAPTVRGRSLARAAADHSWGRQDPPAAEAKVIIQKPIVHETPSPWAEPTPIEEPERVRRPLLKNPRPAAGARPEPPKDQARHADNDATYVPKAERSTEPLDEPQAIAAPWRDRSTLKTVLAVVALLLAIFTGFLIRDSNLLALTPNPSPETASTSVAKNPSDPPKKGRLVAVTTETLKDVAKAHPGSGGTIDAWHWAGNDWHSRSNNYKDWPVDPNKVRLNCDGVKGFRYWQKDGFDTFDATNCKVSYPSSQPKTP